MGTETIKSIAYAGIAVALSGVAFFSYLSSRPKPVELDSKLDQPLFDEFAPTDAKYLQIVKYNQDTDDFDEFRVEQIANKGWVIPSHSNYPADAVNQMKQAANSMLDLKVLHVINDPQEDQAKYGVIEPDREKVQTGQEGVGIRVTVQDRNKQPLADLLIGKSVKDDPSKRFVRLPGQSPVYVVQYDPSVLKTDFKDWIEKNLLQLNAIDVDTLTFKNYQLNPEELLKGKALIAPHFDAIVKSEVGGWLLTKLDEFSPETGEPTQRSLTDDEELNAVKLNEVKTELSGLQIVEVFRKPKGLGANLKAGKALPSGQEDALSLTIHGFALVRNDDRTFDLKATNGELLVGMKNGVEYRLLFGNISGAEEGSGGKLKRFLMVTTRVNEDHFPMPVKQELPPVDSGTDSAATKEGPPKPDMQDPNGSSDDQPPSRDNQQQSTDEKQSSQEKESTQDQEAQEEEREKERQRLEREYLRQVDARNEKIKQAKQSSDQLNARFAEWYYVVSEDAYSRLHLALTDLIKPKQPTE